MAAVEVEGMGAVVGSRGGLGGGDDAAAVGRGKTIRDQQPSWQHICLSLRLSTHAWAISAKRSLRLAPPLSPILRRLSRAASRQQ